MQVSVHPDDVLDQHTGYPIWCEDVDEFIPARHAIILAAGNWQRGYYKVIIPRQPDPNP